MTENDIPNIVAYHKEFRTALFLSSLTLGTFLFTMKTFIVNTMKVDVYDSEEYQKRITERRQNGEMDSYYAPLKRFSHLISAAIVCAIINAVLQITLGYVGEYWSVVVCLGFSVLSWTLVCYVLWLVSRNLVTMLDDAEKRAVRRTTANDKGH